MIQGRYCRRCRTRKKEIEFGLAYCVPCEKDLTRPDLLKHNPHLCTSCQKGLKYRLKGKRLEICEKCYELKCSMKELV